MTEQSRKMLLLPKGFAHGFCSLTELSEVMYKVDNYYNKQAERAIRFNDPEIGIDWKVEAPILLERDSNAPLLKDCDISFK